MKLLSFYAIILVGFYSSAAFSEDEIADKTVTSIGIQVLNNGTPQETNVNYFRVAEGWSLYPCAFGVMYFDGTTPVGRSWLAALLTAKASGNQISRVVYAVNPSDGTCTATNIIEMK
jgi:hypothetical protein